MWSKILRGSGSVSSRYPLLDGVPRMCMDSWLRDRKELLCTNSRNRFWGGSFLLMRTAKDQRRINFQVKNHANTRGSGRPEQSPRLHKRPYDRYPIDPTCLLELTSAIQLHTFQVVLIIVSTVSKGVSTLDPYIRGETDIALVYVTNTARAFPWKLHPIHMRNAKWEPS